MMHVLDGHAHLFHPRWYPEAFARQLIGSLAPERQSPRREQVLLRALSDDTGASTIRMMDAAGIDHRIVLVLDWGLELGEAALPIRQIHEEILAICAAFPDRLSGFAGLDPRRPEAADILTYACDELGARGLKLHPTSAGWTLEDERTERLVEIVDERGLPVLVHIGGTFQPLTDRHAGPRALLALAAKYPGTTFIAGHAGFARWREFCVLEDRMPNVLLDISGWQSLDDGTAGFAHELEAILLAFPGHVVFGTDSPFFGLPAAGADARWVERVREIVLAAGNTDGTAFFAHPALTRTTGASR